MKKHAPRAKELCTYPGPKLRAVNRFSWRDILGGGDIERVVLLFAFGTLESNLSLLLRGSEIY